MTEIIALKDFSMESLRLAIVTLLFRRKLHQQDLAKKIGCSDSHLSRVLSGQTQPSMEMMIKIFEALDVKISLHESEEENASSS